LEALHTPDSAGGKRGAPLHDIEAGVARFWEPLEPLRAAGRLGPVLWQLPPDFARDDDLLAAALDALPPARHCFEFRHPSWFVAGVRRLLKGRGDVRLPQQRLERLRARERAPAPARVVRVG
jgi:uncharacterized protein YecE (DUF72 family)